MTARIMHKCKKKPLATESPLALEKLVKLLIIGGPSLRAEDQGLSEYTSPLKEMVEKKKVPSKLRFLVQNFLELHKSDLKQNRAGPCSFSKKALEVGGRPGPVPECISSKLHTPGMGRVFNWSGIGAFLDNEEEISCRNMGSWTGETWRGISNY